MSKTETSGSPLLVHAEFAFTKSGEQEFLRYREQTLAEIRNVDGCIQAVLWTRPERRYQFSTLWDDATAVTRWVENEFHKTILMPGFRSWCTEGWFGEYKLQSDHPRAHKCARCGRWTQGLPGWDERQPEVCEKC